MDLSLLAGFLSKFLKPRPTQTTGAYTGMETPSYEAPAPVSTGEAFKQGLGGVAETYLNSVPLSKKGVLSKVSFGDLSNLYKFFTTGSL